MKKFLKRFFILLLIFIAGVAVTAVLLNSETTDDRMDMNNPSFPELMVDMDGTAVNRMYGYAQPMQADFTRDSITPLDTTKSLTFIINPYDTKVTSLSYEIRTSDGSKVMENRKIKNLEKADSMLRAQVEINSSLLMNQEYSMQITLDTEKGPVYYYTRVISRSQVNAGSYASFVKNFYEKCMDKTTADDLASYIEPTESGNATNFSNINIHSSLSEISWGSMKPQIHKKGIPVIRDINETTASISIEYQISSKNDEGQSEIYDVTEFYRLRYDETRIRLLDFERSANRVFDPSLPVVSDEGLMLGVRDKNVKYAVNEDATVIAFVQQGDLWSYSPGNGKITKIFSFRKEEDGDFRDSRTAHDIKIIRVDADGDVDFVLYGYMNRGHHEGYCGVCVYHYSNDQNVVEEKVFIPVTESCEFLEQDLGILSYVNPENRLFLLFAQNLYQVNIDEQTFEILEKNIQGDTFVVSDTNAHAAWLVSEGDDRGKIKEISFDTGETRLLVPDSGEQLRTLGFMNEDMIYGLLRDSDILTDRNGQVTEGMHTLRIESFEGEVKKEYSQSGLYITDTTIGNTLMEFELSKPSKNGYKVRKKDNITNNQNTSANMASISLISGSRTGVQIRLTLDEKPETDTPLIVRAKMRSVEGREVALDTKIPEDEIYYVYAGGGLDGTYTNPAEAVRQADKKLGVVLNRAQQYVWERGNKKTKIQMNLEDVPEAMRSASWDKKALQEAMGDAGTIIDLTGCTLDSVLYEVSAQRPVIAKTGAKKAVVIVGYDEYNTYLYDPEKNEIYPYGMNDSTELFEKAGNIFISYIEAL